MKKIMLKILGLSGIDDELKVIRKINIQTETDVKHLIEQTFEMQKEIDSLKKKLYNEMVARKNEFNVLNKIVNKDWVGEEMHIAESEAIDKELNSSIMDGLNGLVGLQVGKEIKKEWIEDKEYIKELEHMDEQLKTLT